MRVRARFNLSVAMAGLAWLIGPATVQARAEGMAARQNRAHAMLVSDEIYSDTANAREEIRQAVLKAASEHKRVLLVFGGNWCADCHVLDLYFHNPGNAALLAANYVLVDVNVGEYDRNLDLARKYGIPLNKGVPALVVLDGDGRLLYSQSNGEFEHMRGMDSAAVTAFLQRWKPRRTTTPHGSRAGGLS